MRGLSHHLPLLMLTATLLLGVVSCGEEPSGKHHGNRVDPTPVDTTHRNDTTGHHGTDTTGNTGSDTTAASFTITIEAERDFGYMGETLQLHAVTTSPSPVFWKSTRTSAVTVDSSGLATFNNAIHDDTTLIIATAGTVSDTIPLINRCWNVAVWDGTAWQLSSRLSVQRGDTVVVSIVDSNVDLINDHGFNAAACQWTITCRNAESETIARTIATPTHDNGWKQQWLILDDAPVGAVFTIYATFHGAAATQSCVIIP